VKRTGRREVAAFDAERGYGLHWRRELNWRTLAFEFVAGHGDGDGDDGVEEEEHNGEGEFHA